MKAKYVLVVAWLALLMSASTVDASLNVSVSVEHVSINQNESQTITATTNEKGKGILFVIQPDMGKPWIDFLEDHPSLKTLWNLLPNAIQTAIANKIGGKIVSFRTVSTDLGGGSTPVTFPEDFTGINGIPSTALVGKYKVVFGFLSWESASSLSSEDGGSPCCCLVEVDFDCHSWFVVPEVPFGTIVTLLSAIIAIPPTYLHKLHKKEHLTSHT